MGVKYISKRLLKPTHGPLTPIHTTAGLFSVYHKAGRSYVKKTPSSDFFLEAMKGNSLTFIVGNGYYLLNDCYYARCCLGGFYILFLVLKESLKQAV